MANQYSLSVYIAQVTMPTIPTGLSFCAPFPNSLIYACIVVHACMWFHGGNKRCRGMFLQLGIKEIRSRLSVSTSGWCGRGDSPKCHTVSWHGITIVTSCFQRDWHFPGTYHMLGIMPRPGHELCHLNIHRKACKGGFIITARLVRKQIHRDGVPEKS